MVQPIGTYAVVPYLPSRLARLRDLAYNLHWSWEYGTVDLFRSLSAELWEAAGHNPVRLLGLLSPERLEEAANDESFLAHLDRVWAAFHGYLHPPSTWYAGLVAGPRPRVAYFTMEFGLTEALPIYSGGLGVLAGDHLKSASDLGVDLVGVGLLYQQGYFRQRLNAEGWQEEHYPINDFSLLPVLPESGPDGTPRTVTVALPGRQVTMRLWRVLVGRLPLIMLDTNLPVNEPHDRDITDRLYYADLDMRIRQEIVLGIGGLRALHLLGLDPDICHLNEGHSAFLILERIRTLMAERHLSFAEAREVARAGTIFTTHTPVPAGIDRFPRQAIEHYFGAYCHEAGIPLGELLALAREHPADPHAPCSPTMLALRLSARSNGVSRLHGVVSRRLFQPLWPGLPAEMVPISSVTNGVHQRSVVARDMQELYGRHLGARWHEQSGDPSTWAAVGAIPPEELWRAHERCRERLVFFARQRLEEQLVRQRAKRSEREWASEALSPTTLTIGFGRRFATYKRGTLLLRDPERLARLLNRPGQPVQIVYAGKAHPADEPAKQLVRALAQLHRRPEFRDHLVFLEDYELTVARHMVQGCDVWLNTPRLPNEASGTSGMKAAANGGLNVSILDGWWAEAYQPEIGWAIDHGELWREEDHERQDQVDSESLYDLLEREVIPLFYERDPSGLPQRWIERMKAAIVALGPAFNAHRMLTEYVEGYYLPAAEQVGALLAGDAARARAFAPWVEKVRAAWPQVAFEAIHIEQPRELIAGECLPVTARLRLGGLGADDVSVEVYYGPLDPAGAISPETASTASLTSCGAVAPGVVEFSGQVASRAGGAGGYAIYAQPRHRDLAGPFGLHLIRWANPAH